MKIMVREMSLIRGLGAPAKEMSFPHHLALFKDLSCPLLPTIARHCPLLPAKKMLQALVASQYGRRSRGPGRVPRAVHETRFSPSLRRLQGEQPQARPTGFHESRDTNHESRLFFESRLLFWGGYGAAWAAYCPRAVRRHSRRPPSPFRRGEPQMNPCRDRRTFWIARTSQLYIYDDDTGSNS